MHNLGDVFAEFDHVDDPDVLERMKTTPALRAALQIARPENWWGTGLNPKTLFAIAKDDGIPVVEVLPTAILCDIAAAPDRNARISILLARKQEIIDHCKEILHLCTDPCVDDMRMLTEKAIAAYEDGHHEAAMALAVSIGETSAKWASIRRWQFFESKAAQEAWEKNRKKVGEYGLATLELSTIMTKHSSLDEWQRAALIAPIHSFFTKYYPNRGQEPPEALSRHVVAHQPTPHHFSLENALVSLMLVTSFLYPMQEWSADVREQDYFAEIQEQSWLAEDWSEGEQ